MNLTPIISDHKFSAIGEWWDLCRICRLPRASHEGAELEYVGDTDDD